MTESLRLWSPRILGILVALFLSVFALDAFDGGKTLVEVLPDLVVHVIPTVILLLVIALSWRREWIGGVVFTLLAVGYAYTARDHFSWILVIAGPLLVVGILFFVSAAHRRKLDRA